MTDAKPEQHNGKKLNVVIAVLVGLNIITAFYAIDFFYGKSSFDKIPISLTEPSLQKKCHDLVTELDALSERLGKMEQDEISYSDIKLFNSLQTEVLKSGCQ